MCVGPPPITLSAYRVGFCRSGAHIRL